MLTKKLILTSLLFFIICSQSIAQEIKPMLDAPQDWRYEKINLPFDFAPELPYRGSEELRFAPGMFDRTSKNYFTYMFLASLEGEKKVTKRGIKTFLKQYYQGLSKAVAIGKNMDVAIEKIKISVEKVIKPNAPNTHYNATILYLDTFNNGEEVLLHLEMEVISSKKKQHTYLMVLVSPQQKYQAIWDFMRTTRQNIVLR